MKKIFTIAAALLLSLSSSAFAGYGTANNTMPWFIAPQTMQNVHDDACDEGAIVVNRADMSLHIMTGCNNRTPTDTLIWPIASSMVTFPGSTAQYVRGDGSLATFPTAGTRTFNSPSRALNSCFQISSTQDADFHYKVDVSSGTLLQATSTGTVTATSYTNSGCTTGARVESDGAPSQSAALGILSVAQLAPVGIDGILEHGRWMKITTAQTVGTPTFAIRGVQAEILLP